MGAIGRAKELNLTGTFKLCDDCTLVKDKKVESVKRLVIAPKFGEKSCSLILAHS